MAGQRVLLLLALPVLVLRRQVAQVEPELRLRLRQKLRLGPVQANRLLGHRVGRLVALMVVVRGLALADPLHRRAALVQVEAGLGMLALATPPRRRP